MFWKKRKTASELMGIRPTSTTEVIEQAESMYDNEVRIFEDDIGGPVNNDITDLIDANPPPAAPRPVIQAPDPFSVAHHVENIKAILDSVQNRRESLIEAGRIEREDFERREAERAAQVAELDRLTATYEAAIGVATPVQSGDLSGLGRHESGSESNPVPGDRLGAPRQRRRQTRPNDAIHGADGTAHNA